VEQLNLEHEVLGGVDDRPREAAAGCGTGVVGDEAVSSDLSLPPGEHVDHPHLDVREGELVEEGVLVEGELGDDGPGGGVFEEVLVGGEEPHPVEQVDVVLVVEFDWRPDVIDRLAGGALHRAHQLEEVEEPLGHGRVARREEAVLEGQALRSAHGVGAQQRHQVDRVQVERGKDGQEPRHVGCRPRLAGQDFGLRRRFQAVATTQRDLVPRTATLRIYICVCVLFASRA
jgi:hypothetical protein